MQRAEDARHDVRLDRGFFEAHQVGVELIEVLVRLDQELFRRLLQLGHGGYSNCSRRPRTISGLKLLSHTADTPSCRTTASFWGSDSLVTTITGTRGAELRWRMNSSRPRPPRRGMV